MKPKPNLFYGWISLTFAFTIHIIDEALNDFLSIYNPIVTNFNESFGFLIFPVFSFSQWLVGLIIANIILYSLSIYAYRNKKWFRYLSFIYSSIMILNAIGHITGSIYLGKSIAGLYSAPLLLVGGIYLFWSSFYSSRIREH
ncbi:MAG: hypothetical protein R3250_08585 [Melioribacteraceae bacterium]|nr:hypothetical protein [Melioribacteraceae bacterium]